MAVRILYKPIRFFTPSHNSGARVEMRRLLRAEIRLIREMRRFIGVSDDREKSFGAPEGQISPQPPQFEPLPKRFFSPSHSKDLICQAHLLIIRMKWKFLPQFRNISPHLQRLLCALEMAAFFLCL